MVRLGEWRRHLCDTLLLDAHGVQVNMSLQPRVDDSGATSVTLLRAWAIYCPHKADAAAVSAVLERAVGVPLPTATPVAALCRRVRTALSAAAGGAELDIVVERQALLAAGKAAARAAKPPPAPRPLSAAVKQSLGMSESSSWRLSEGATVALPAVGTPSSARGSLVPVLAPRNVNAGQGAPVATGKGSPAPPGIAGGVAVAQENV